jgi:heme ABC exporter ATP-binding subunit CcmA
MTDPSGAHDLATHQDVVARDVWKYFGDFPALRAVSLSVPPGACLALLGRNGAGKTTFLRILCGLVTASRGDVRIAPKEKRGMLGHGIGIYDELTALENLQLFGRLYGVAAPRQRAAEWLERVGLAHVAHARAREFSRGMRQRLAVARAFLHEPELLLLDEPFTSLDDRAIALLQGLLRERLRAGATVVMSTHQLREAMELATHAALLVRGSLRFLGPRPEEMLTDPGWLYRTHGEAA